MALADEMSFFKSLFKQDAGRWLIPGQIADAAQLTTATMIKLFIRHPQLRAMLMVRFSAWCQRKHVRGLPLILHRLVAFFYGLEVIVSQDIGGGLYIPQPFGTVIMVEKMGKNCSVIQDVTIGMRNEHAFPIIGDNVTIGPGARVLGGIHIGDGAYIAANSVVISDVPPCATAVGIPAKIIN